jgi:hypothetical protein
VRGNDRLALGFAVTFGLVGFVISYVLARDPLPAALFVGFLSFAVGAALMIMLRWRP